MKKYHSLAMMTAMMMMGGLASPSGYGQEQAYKNPEAERIKRDEIRRKKGLKPFLYGDDLWIWARDQKNADRKYKNYLETLAH